MTEFAIIRKDLEGELEKGEEIFEDNYDYGVTFKIAKRTNGGHVFFLYDCEGIVSHLSDEAPVYPVGNCAMGIYTVGDIRNKIKEQEK